MLQKAERLSPSDAAKEHQDIPFGVMSIVREQPK